MDAHLVGAFFPILAKRIPALKIPNIAFIIAKFFGSGVIIATAFIHVLSHSTTAILSSMVAVLKMRHANL